MDVIAKLQALLDDLRRHDSVLWRRAIHAGVERGPEAFVRHSPALFGLVVGALLPRQRRAIERNLRRMLGPRARAKEQADVAKVFVNFACCLTETFIASSNRREQLVGRCLNDDRYMGARAEGKGVIIATAHIGGWQAAGPILRSVHPDDVLIVMLRERDGRAQAVQDGLRDRAGMRVAHIGTSPLDALPLLAHLRKRGVLAVQIDRVPEGMRGREVKLFGGPWWLPEGPLVLSALSGAPVVPVFTRRLGFMQYEVHIGVPLHLPRRPTSTELDTAAQGIATEMESFLRANPTQWFHFE